MTVKGLHRIEVRDSKGDPDEAFLDVKYRKILILPQLENESDTPPYRLARALAHGSSMNKNIAMSPYRILFETVRRREDSKSANRFGTIDHVQLPWSISSCR